MSHEPQPTEGTPTAPAQAHPPAFQAPATLVPEQGWHVLHLFYGVDHEAWSGLSSREREDGRLRFLRALAGAAEAGVSRWQCFAIPGHKADFGIMLAGPDLKAIHNVQTLIQVSELGWALTPAYSFYSLTEVSEYVPDAEEYGRILRDREGVDPETPAYRTKVAQYAQRLGPMNQQRLYPEFPDWPCLCFYPMSKMRQGDQNWYLLPFEQRAELMSAHGRSGMKFAGRVTQLITASTGLDDWEWGVTLWARNPAYLKEIVYAMRFDESSAKYALFGDFYFGYILPPAELLETIRV